MTRFVRTKGGQMVHRSECTWGETGIPWMWAERVPAQVVREAVADLGSPHVRALSSAGRAR